MEKLGGKNKDESGELLQLIARLDALLNPTKDKGFSERISREVRRLFESKKIQGIYEGMGDKILNEYVDRKYPYTGAATRNDKLNTLLKSNWFLNRIYRRLKLPVPPERFINEKVYRYGKRGASLFEWYIGLYFLGTGGQLPKRTQMIKNNLYNYFDKIFADITISPGNERELELTWYEFTTHQQKIKYLKESD